ncbi:MAG: hypothetical protein LUF89_04820 [Ruminococcus sp.]|nr:hypothetical protein [Ruminococcus sp.]
MEWKTKTCGEIRGKLALLFRYSNFFHIGLNYFSQRLPRIVVQNQFLLIEIPRSCAFFFST